MLGDQRTAVLLHELPHEVGDVAILIAAGYRPSQAVKMQFCTALGAMLGTLVGLLSGTYFSAASEVIICSIQMRPRHASNC